MVVKVVSMKSVNKSSFSNLMDYLKKEQTKENIRDIATWIEPNEYYDNLDLLLQEVNDIQSWSKSKKDKTYHLVVSFPENERPDVDTLKSISDEIVESLGYEKHQRVTVVHDDTDNLHMHIAINKVDMEKHNIHEPYYPYKILSKKAEELEIKYDLERTHQNKNKNKENVYSKANDIDSRPGTESFKSYISKIDLSECKTWEDFHNILNENGVNYVKYGSGAVFKDLKNDKLHVKASVVNRDLTLSKLEKKYGKFQESKYEKLIKNSYERNKDTELKNEYKLDEIARKSKLNEAKAKLNEEELPEVPNYWSRSSTDELTHSLYNFTSDMDRQVIKISNAIAKVFIKKNNKEQREKAINERKKIKEQKKEEIKKIYKENPYQTYDLWLQTKAFTNAKAEEILHERKIQRSNFIEGDFSNLKKEAIKITKAGTYILKNNIRANKEAIFSVSTKDNSIKKVLEKIENNKINPISINGTDEFIDKVIDIISKKEMNITFQDENINNKILAAKIFNKENINDYIIQNNNKIMEYERFDGKEQEYIYKGFEKYQDKFLIKLKSTNQNVIYVKEVVQEDYSVFKGMKIETKVKINTPIKNSLEIESYINRKKESRIVFKELKENEYNKEFKRISTKEHNGQKIYLYKKENDRNVYVSKTLLVMQTKEILNENSQENKKEKIKKINKGMER